MIKAIAFDLDGVLVDACDWHKDALNLALRDFGQPEIDDLAHKNIYNALTTKTKLEKLGVPVDLRSQIEEKKQVYTRSLIEKYCHYDDALVKILWLLKQDGYKLSCVTNSSEDTAKMMLRKCGVLPLLDLVVTNTFGGLPKPNGDPYAYCAKKFDLQPNQVLAVEDSYKGIESARRAGCRLLEVASRHSVSYQKIKECVYNDQQFLF